MDSKRKYIHFLLGAKDADAVDSMESSQTPEVDKGYFTFFTAGGIVVGKRTEIKPVNFKELDDFSGALSERFSDGGTVSIYDIAAGMYNNYMKELESKRETEIIGDSKAIVLEDVFIKLNNNDNIKVDTYILFTDQITGIIPGRIHFN